MFLKHHYPFKQKENPFKRKGNPFKRRSYPFNGKLLPFYRKAFVRFIERLGPFCSKPSRFTLSESIPLSFPIAVTV